MRRRCYDGPEDVQRLQQFTAQQIHSHGRVGLMHPGDIPHRIFNALRPEDPCEILHIWEDGYDNIAAWTLLDPQGAGFDLQISAAARASEPHLEAEFFDWAEDTLLELMKNRTSEATSIETDAFVEDLSRTGLLERKGWVPQGDELITLGRRELADIPDPEPPPGYRVRCVRGVEEAAAVSALHSAGFRSSWTPELYRRVMESPGYEPDRELVIEAPDGTLAAFCVTWPDDVNRIGLFEPVAVHPEHRRLGLGSAVLRAGMRAMKAWGMDWAEVMYEVNNPGAEPLYCSEGFEPAATVVLYRKPVSRGS